MVAEISSGMMVATTEACLPTTAWTGKAITAGLTTQTTKANGKTVRCMVKEHLSLAMDVTMSAASSTIKRRGTENTTGMMEELISANGCKVSSMVWVHL